MEPNFNDEIPFETALPCASDSVPAPISPDDEIDGYPVELLQAYIKNNSDIYIERFRALSEGKITFHWPAFFFQPMWYFYRGLYNWGLITLLIYLVAPIITFPIIFFYNAWCLSFYALYTG